MGGRGSVYDLDGPQHAGAPWNQTQQQPAQQAPQGAQQAPQGSPSEPGSSDWYNRDITGTGGDGMTGVPGTETRPVGKGGYAAGLNAQRQRHAFQNEAPRWAQRGVQRQGLNPAYLNAGWGQIPQQSAKDLILAGQAAQQGPQPGRRLKRFIRNRIDPRQVAQFQSMPVKEQRRYMRGMQKFMNNGGLVRRYQAGGPVETFYDPLQAQQGGFQTSGGNTLGSPASRQRPHQSSAFPQAPGNTARDLILRRQTAQPGGWNALESGGLRPGENVADFIRRGNATLQHSGGAYPPPPGGQFGGPFQGAAQSYPGGVPIIPANMPDLASVGSQINPNMPAWMQKPSMPPVPSWVNNPPSATWTAALADRYGPSVPGGEGQVAFNPWGQGTPGNLGAGAGFPLATGGSAQGPLTLRNGGLARRRYQAGGQVGGRETFYDPLQGQRGVQMMGGNTFGSRASRAGGGGGQAMQYSANRPSQPAAFMRNVFGPGTGQSFTPSLGGPFAYDRPRWDYGGYPFQYPERPERVEPVDPLREVQEDLQSGQTPLNLTNVGGVGNVPSDVDMNAMRFWSHYGTPSQQPETVGPLPVHGPYPENPGQTSFYQPNRPVIPGLPGGQQPTSAQWFQPNLGGPFAPPPQVTPPPGPTGFGHGGPSVAQTLNQANQFWETQGVRPGNVDQANRLDQLASYGLGVPVGVPSPEIQMQPTGSGVHFAPSIQQPDRTNLPWYNLGNPSVP